MITTIFFEASPLKVFTLPEMFFGLTPYVLTEQTPMIMETLVKTIYNRNHRRSTLTGFTVIVSSSLDVFWFET